jgi:predicted  nucleic acid-binding Zn-ribbon protein
LREQLQLLLKLQLCDVKVKELEATIQQLPLRLDPARKDLAKLEAMVAGERARLDETLKWKKEQQELLDRDQDQLKTAKIKLQSSRNTKEFNAANRESDNKKKAITDREAELKKMTEALGKSTGSVEAHVGDVEKLRAQIAAEEQAIALKIGEVQGELALAKAARDQMRTHLEKSWLKTYDSVVAKKGYAIASVAKGVCMGCHMALPPQLNNILARMDSIESCPCCGRMIYRKELLENLDEAAAVAK